MNARSIALALLAVVVATAPPLASQTGHGGHDAHHDHHDHGDHGDHAAGHGSVVFPTSCAPEVQARFERAVAQLHSFGYEVAAQTFAEVAAADPACGMAHWGVATTYYHPLWAAPTPEELATGRAAAERAAEVGAATERERAWIAAIGAFYADSESVDHRARALRYGDALATLAERFPDDDEARIFHALSLLGTAPPSDTAYAQQHQAVALLTPLVPRYPEHPGVAHYLIHSLDYPELAHLGLDAARRYARIAPGSSHALHMPSHIFVRLGLWPEAIASNLDSAASARAMRPAFSVAAAFDELHALDYLAYAYLQTGRDEDAADVVRQAQAFPLDGPQTLASAYALAAIAPRYHLERGDWAGAAAIPDPPAGAAFPPFARALPAFARAVGATRSGHPDRAAADLDQLAALQQQLAASPPPGPYDWAGHVEVLRRAAAGLVARARGRDEEALRLLGEAAELEARVGKHPVTPGTLLPPRELLAEVLLELGQAAEALAAFEATLVEAPNRLRALAGAARAAALAGHPERARTLQNLVVSVAAPGSRRPEVAEARQRLAGP
jgi:tetratricopeptide (TPR) repeat protein